MRNIILTALVGVLSLVSEVGLAQPAADQCAQESQYNVGAGIYDITGPAAEEGMMGYGMLNQKTAGISTRLWARAFVVESPCNHKRVVFVNTDLGMVFQGVKQEVIKRLQEKQQNDTYDFDNVLLTATHTHSGPGGFSTDIFYNLTTLGFSKKNFNTIVDGIVAAILRAEENLAPATIKVAQGELKGINFNRSPQSYLLNPENERAKYAGDVDTTMTLIRFDRLDGTPIGIINWFPIHGVSMNNKNHLISSDNKGYAELQFEKDYRSDYGPTAFVAAFAQSNAGDVSPNEYGHEGGSGAEGIADVIKAGEPQYQKAKALFAAAKTPVSGGVDYRHEFVDFNSLKVDLNYTDGYLERTCPGAIGVSMLAGTADGEGYGKQGVSCDDISSVFSELVCEMVTTTCQGVKPIAVSTGSKSPPWTPTTVPMQIIKIGQLVITAPPVEVTTMVGRRIKESVAKILPQSPKPVVVMSALSNAYAGYVTTHEEYQLQRYEGASTHFGPWEAAGLQQEFDKLAKALVNGLDVVSAPAPANLYGTLNNYQPGVIYDDKPWDGEFGDVALDVKRTYHPGDTVTAQFWGGHPKNNFHTQGTFMAVEKSVGDHWETIRHDWDFDTEYHWQRHGFADSLITVIWRMPKDVAPGRYRLVQYGDWKSGWTHNVSPYVGYSSVFEVL